jgi:hypothetical protein
VSSAFTIVVILKSGIIDQAGYHIAALKLFIPLFLDNILLGNWQIFGDTECGQTT